MVLDDIFERFARAEPRHRHGPGRPGERPQPPGHRRPLRGGRRAAVHPHPAVLLGRGPDEHRRLPASGPPSTPPTRPTPSPSASRSRPSTTSSTAPSRASRPRWSATPPAPSAPVITAMGGERAAWLPGYRVKILDGNHLAGTEHRLKELRTIGAGALPGQALVVLDPQAMLVTDVFPCEDGHAQERSLLDQVLETIRPGELWIADRNFCTTGFLFGIARRGGSFVIRQHAGDPPHRVGRASGGRAAGSRPGRSSSRRCGSATATARTMIGAADHGGAGQADPGRRDRDPHPDQPARRGRRRPGDRRAVPHALDGGDRLRRIGDAASTARSTRWAIPKAALFAFCVALVSYNVLSVVKAALRSVHGEEAVEEVVGVLPGRRDRRDAPGDDDRHPGGRVGGVPRPDGRGVGGSPAWTWPPGCGCRHYRKHRRGPKRPQPKRASGAKVKHVSTAKLLAERKRRT